MDDEQNGDEVVVEEVDVAEDAEGDVVVEETDVVVEDDGDDD
ncbi:MAG: hypothetical protein ACKOH7_02260 [Solirubrobacterales bacterium]